jgi:tetratricopeptide (TPR) repeat protein
MIVDGRRGTAALTAMGKVMSTKTAPTAWSPAEAALLARPGRAGVSGRGADVLPPGPRLRHLWQVPVFLAGLAAVAVACFGRPLWQPDEQDQLAKVLDGLRQLAAQPGCPVEQFLEQAEPLFTQADRFPAQAAAAHLLAGGVYLSRADKLTGKEAAEAWQQARLHLEQADRLGVPEADRPRLTYRLARSWFYTGENSQRVIEALTAAVATGADDQAEGYDLLARAYLRLPEPDLQGALQANKKLLDLPTVKEEVLAPARLLRGELLLQLGQPGEARNVLAFVKPPDSPPLVRQALFLRARSYQDEEQWVEAVEQWKALLAEKELDPQDQGRYLYQLGVCHRHLEELADAAAAWEQAMSKPAGEDAQAAATSLAELRLFGPAPQQALPAFERVVHDVKKPEDWQNTLIDLARVRELFEHGCQIYHNTGRYELSMQLALLYEKVAAPGVAANLFAQAAEAEAKSKACEAGRIKKDVQRRLQEEVAHGLFRQAARQYEASAAAATGAEQGDRLWRAALCYLHGDEPGSALPILERCLRLGQPADRLDEAWYRTGQARQAAGQQEEALAAYEQCLKIRVSGTWAYRSRYQLALACLARGETDKAAEHLELNLKLLQAEPDHEAEEKSLFELGSLLYRRKDYAMAQFRLELALERYPNSPRAPEGRFDLAECYYGLAQKENEFRRTAETKGAEVVAHHEAQYQQWLTKAEDSYEQLMHALEGLPAARPLTAEEDWLLRQSSFAAAQCCFLRGQYTQALERYEVLARRYQHQVECLHALAGIVQTCYAQRDAAKVKATLLRIRAALGEMDDAAFKNSRWTRREWEEYLNENSKY